MKNVLVSRIKDFDYSKYVKRSAIESDYSKLYKEDITLIDADTNKLVAVYFTLPKKYPAVLEACHKIEYRVDVRTSGLKSTSRIFGYRPRETIRKDFCSSTSLSQDSPSQHNVLVNFARILSDYYEKYCGDVYQAHKKIADEKIMKEWKIEGSPFTSGIVNKNNPLKYHFDAGNFDSVYSNMVAFKKGVSGGYLSIPEYDLGLEIADNSVLLFDGQKLLHGVTPIKYVNKNSYRYTIVYYTLKKMWNCEALSAELARIKKRKTEREFKRFDRMTGKIPSDKL